jgi:hypothetical protein
MATHINEDTMLKTFNNKLLSYKCKNDLITITGALGLPMEGTVVKSYLIGKCFRNVNGNVWRWRRW